MDLLLNTLTDDKGNIPAEMQKPVLGYDGKGLVYSDDFSRDKLELQWQWNHNPVDNAWSLTERKGWLRLKTSRIVPNIFLAHKYPYISRVRYSRTKHQTQCVFCLMMACLRNTCARRDSTRFFC